jgi:diguanylate cyclase (GGDEF)-like protein
MIGTIPKPAILIIDDEEPIRNLLESLLGENNECVLAKSGEDAINLLQHRTFDLAISDINMEGISGLDLVPHLLKESPDTVVLMVSGLQTIETAINAMRAGAFDYMTKPLDLRHVEAAVQRALAHHKLLKEKRVYENHLKVLVEERAAEIERLAYFDSLTKLPNRVLFADRLSQAVKHAQREQKIIAVLLLRLDRFKTINDTLGHDRGTQLLQEIAIRLRSSFGDRGTLARFEADEFGFLMTDVNGSEKVLEALRDVTGSLKPLFVIEGHEIYVTASVGVSLFPADGVQPQELLDHAGIALDRTQSLGSNSSQFYRPEMNKRALDRLTLESELRRAVENEELILYYQPQIDIATRRLCGAEALVRWQHPKLGLVPPLDFIPMAEDTGLILPIGEWVLKSACNQAASWHRSGLPNLRVAVNVSPKQFHQKEFFDTVRRIVHQSLIEPSLLELEITESSLVENAGPVIELLSRLKELGVSIAIDDFGIGYSSLAYLKRLPIDMLKIDRTFVSDAITDPDDAAIVVAIITLAHNLRLEVMAEGVETEELITFLHRLNCDKAQGYLLGKPVPADLFFSRAVSARNRLETQLQLAGVQS